MLTYKGVMTYHTSFILKVASLIQGKLEPDFTLDSEVERNWKEITLGRYQFDRLLKEVDIAKTITQAEVCAWLQRYTLLAGNNRRKLTVQVEM